MPSTTYASTLSAFTRFLAAYTHTVLYLRTLYPRTSFVRTRFCNTPVHQSRHPLVCEWIRDAITAVRHQLLSGAVARIAIVIYHCDPATKGTGRAAILERHMLDVSAFPVVDKDARNAVMEWHDPDAAHPPDHEESDGDDNDPDGDDHGDESDQDASDDSLLVDLTEQFRAALVTLTTRCAQLAPLPPKCSFNLSIELKDDPQVHPPLAHPQSWIPVAPNLQNTASKPTTDAGKASQTDVEDKRRSVPKVTPIRAVEAGVFRFETWVEEGKAKFDLLDNHGPSTLAA